MASEYIIGTTSNRYPNHSSDTTATVTFKQQRRALAGRVFPPLVWGLIRLLWKTCRVQAIIGQEHLESILASDKPFIPCYWHQQQIFCVRHLLDMAQQHSNMQLGYLISPSADGDMATRMFSGQGVHIIRGSATRGGAQALREIYTAIKKQKISPIVTPDGPTGPIFKCKPGVAMLAQLSSAPLLPLAYAGNRVWQLRSWDKFMLPLPFSRVIIGIGAPLTIDKPLAENNFSAACEQMDMRLQQLSEQCAERVGATRQ